MIARLEMNKTIGLNVEMMPASVDVSRTKLRRVAHRDGDKERSNANRRAPSRGIAPLWSITNERAAVTTPFALLRKPEGTTQDSEETIHDLPSRATHYLGGQ